MAILKGAHGIYDIYDGKESLNGLPLSNDSSSIKLLVNYVICHEASSSNVYMLSYYVVLFYVFVYLCGQLSYHRISIFRKW